MKIRWIGHASFHIETADGLRIRTDPYDASIGLQVSGLAADVVTVSHEHFDHNATSLVPGKPAVIRGEGTRTVKGASFRGIATFHDESKGSKRGRNTIFLITADGLTLAHLGDLGHTLTADLIATMGRIDILCIPVGGIYTLDSSAASDVAAAINAAITVPMHYKTPGLTVGVGPVDKFLSGKPNVVRMDELTVSKESLPSPAQVVVLTPRP